MSSSQARSSGRFVSLAAVLASCAIAACSSSASEPSGGELSDDVVGGVDAKSARLDAVGSLVLEANGAKSPFCTGTLISPTVVLTAKHCTTQPADAATGAREALFTELGTVTFAIGFDAAAPRREVKAKSIDRARLDVGGIGFGADVAVYVLSEPIVDIAPLPIATTNLGEAELGKAFVAMGYGIRDRAGSAGRRTMGNITLSSLDGKPYQQAFGTFEEFAASFAASGQPLTPAEEPAARALYDQPLLAGYEAFFAAKEGDAQVCSGDSGGPLLRKVDGKLTIFGVASWVPSKSEKAPCSRGQVYAVFGPSARELVTDALGTACGDVPVAGRCEGAVAVRCVSTDEGTPRVTRTSCEDVDQACGIVDGVAACIDP